MTKEKKFKIGRLVIFTIMVTMCLSALALFPTATASTINVPSDYSTIQEAIDNANPGDTIMIADDSYPEQVTIDKPLTIAGEPGMYPKVNPTSIGGGIVFTLNSENVTITGLNISNVGGPNGMGIWEGGYNPQYHNLTVDDCIFYNLDRGIRYYGDNLIVTNSTFYRMDISGIYASGPNTGSIPLKVTIKHNFIYGAAETDDSAGIWMKYCDRYGEIAYNYIASYRMGIAYYDGGPIKGKVSIYHNTIDLDTSFGNADRNTTMGISFYGTSENCKNITVRDNIISQATWYGIYGSDPGTDPLTGGSITVDNNLFYDNYWYYWPNYQYTYQWNGTGVSNGVTYDASDIKTIVGWGNEPIDGYTFLNNVVRQDPLFEYTDTTPDSYWALQSGSPAMGTASDGTNIGAWQLPCQPEVWVDDDYDSSTSGWQTDHFATIQDGVDGVCDGGTIHVLEGVYNPISTIIVDKPVSILGPQAGVDPRPFNNTPRIPGDSSEAVVDAGGLLGNIFYVAADDVTIDGLEITHGTDDLIYSSSPAIGNTMVTNCIVHGSTGDEGIQLKNCQFGSIHRNYIFDVAQDGANFGYSQSCELSENEITTSDSENAAIFVYRSADILIAKNIVHDTTAANGIALYENNGDIEVINNLVVDNEWMIKSKHHDYSGNAILGYKYTETGSTVTILHNTLSNNKVSDSSTYHANEIGFGNGIGINTLYPPYHSLDYDGFLTIKNNIISTNGLPSYGYGLITKEYYGCPGPTSANCIIEYNDIYNNGAGSCLGTFCPVDTLTNIFVDPLFVSLGSDYQLQYASPCRDSATSLGILDDVINNARDSTPDRGAYEYIMTCAPEVWVDDNADSSWYDFTHVQTVQEGIDHVCPGGTVYVEEGIYNENVVVDKHLKMIGSGSDSSGSIITQDTAGAGDSHVGVVQITASGLSETDSLLFQDLRVEPIGLAGFSIGRFCQATATSVEYVTLDNVYVIGTNTYPSTEQERGLYVDLTSSLSYLSVVDSAFNDLTYGWYLQKQVSADLSTVDHVTVINTQFNHNNHKGIYAEKLSDATFTDCIIQNNGFDSSALPSYFAPWSAGVDFNLKAGTYQDFVFESCIFEDNAIDEAKEGVALTVKERGTGLLDTSYSSFPAHVDDVFVYDCIFTNNERGIRFGEPGKDNVGPTNVVVKCCIIEGNEQQYSGSDGSTYGGLINTMQSLVLAEDNYWGDCSGPSGVGPGSGDAVSTNVDFDPWGGVVADAGGPYDANTGEIIQFDSSGSCYCPTAVVDYFWDFGDGYSGPEQYLENPTHSYTGESDMFVVCLTITVTGDSCSWSDSISTTVTIGDEDPPIIQLISPEDGDNVNGVVTVEWYAIDDSYPPAQIYLYYKPSDAGSDAWRQINDVLTNNIDTEHGSYDWDTSGFADGEYDLLAEALDNDHNIAHQSITINIGNGNSGVMLSDVFVEDTSIDSSHYVKDGDTVVVSAGITGNGDLTVDDITADLSGFGLGSQTPADSFDGFTATWTLENVVCHPSDGTISVTVSVLDMSKTATITADNTAPEVTVDKPTSGFWFYNSRLLPLGNTFILGPIEVQVSGSSDISRVEFFVDDDLMYTDTEANFEWYMNQKLRGVHTLTVTVYDLAGNPTTTSQQVRVFNLFGEN